MSLRQPFGPAAGGDAQPFGALQLQLVLQLLQPLRGDRSRLLGRPLPPPLPAGMYSRTETLSNGSPTSNDIGNKSIPMYRLVI